MPSVQGPVNLVCDASCWQCEYEWRQDLAVVTKWLSGMSMVSSSFIWIVISEMPYIKCGHATVRIFELLVIVWIFYLIVGWIYVVRRGYHFIYFNGNLTIFFVYSYFLYLALWLIVKCSIGVNLDCLIIEQKCLHF